MRWIWILLVIVAGSLAGYLATHFEGTPPVIQTRTAQVYVGDEHTQEFRVTDQGTGVEGIRVWVESGGQAIELYDQTYPGNLFTGASAKTLRAVDATLRPKELGLSDGNAVLVVEARDFSWRGNVTRVDIPLIVDTKAPRLSLKTGLSYARRGGAEMIVYEINEQALEHGVQVGELTFRGFPHPQDPSTRVALYALPADGTDEARPQVFAVDRAGNRSVASVPVEIIGRTFPTDQIQLSERFMELKVNELIGSHDDSVLTAYLKINREMRAEDGKTILEICQQSSTDRLWRGAFKQLPNSQVGARFSEKRTYVYDGQIVDTQTHMGFDLASTAHAAIPAANDGVVVFADRLGIYGNAVILDHGLGLFSLYGHLSDVTVEKGQAVAGGERVGATGTTGLAGGDHLHFAVMVSGVFVDPLEWLDERWIREHIEPKLTPPGGESG